MMTMFPSMGPAMAGGAGPGMMGLLNDPKMAALLGASSGLLSAAGPTPQKVGLGGAMGAGLGGAAAGMIGAEQMQADREMQKLMREFMQQQLGQGAQGGMPGMAPQAPTPPQMPGMGMPRQLRIGAF